MKDYIIYMCSCDENLELSVRGIENNLKLLLIIREKEYYTDPRNPWPKSIDLSTGSTFLKKHFFKNGNQYAWRSYGNNFTFWMYEENNLQQTILMTKTIYFSDDTFPSIHPEGDGFAIKFRDEYHSGGIPIALKNDDGKLNVICSDIPNIDWPTRLKVLSILRKKFYKDLVKRYGNVELCGRVEMKDLYFTTEKIQKEYDELTLNKKTIFENPVDSNKCNMNLCLII